MTAHHVALVATVGLTVLLAFLTISVMLKDGFSPIVGVSLVILALFLVGALGALTNPPRQ